ncbi:MAG: M4 family metallopeptidase [Cytophaga sp.]|uniref:M4 family metallopeptidase n=1 Tax=Cytophaga sp. TaxID=29535 RepID=UPI003F81158F
MKQVTCTVLFTLATVFLSSAQSLMEEKEKSSYSGIKPAINATINGSNVKKTVAPDAHSLMPGLARVTKNDLLFPSKARNIIYRSQQTGQPIFVLAKATFNTNSRVAYAGGQPDESYLQQLNALLGLSSAEKMFRIDQTCVDPLGGKILRLKQYYHSLEIDGSESIIHINQDGVLTSWNGLYIDPATIKSTSFPVPQQTAVQKALTDLSGDKQVYDLSDAEKFFLEYSGPEARAVYYIDNKVVQTCVPAYIVEIRPNFVDWMEYVIDANTGNILASYSKTCHVDGPRTSTGTDLNGTQQTINTYQIGTSYYAVDGSRSMFDLSTSSMPDNPVGAIQTLDLKNTWGSSTSFSSIKSSTNTFNPTTISAHYIAGKAYDYYFKVHNRNSINGSGSTIISFINVADPDNGSAMDNAFWNGKAIYYGNGNTLFKPLAGALDVGGHELTHGVIQNTANLAYSGESGAINESMADIFGCMIDSLDWKIGEDVVKPGNYPTGALRDLSDPHNGGTDLSSPGWQPRVLSEKYQGSGDNGGVHINSGIPNYAFYLLAQATKRTSAEKIFYRALTTYLVRSSQFIDLRIACIQAAKDIFGNTSAEATATGNAFDMVEITDGSGTPITPTTDDVIVNNGQDLLLGYNLNPATSQKLFRLNLKNSGNTTISNTTVTNRPSVTDDGSRAYFVNSVNQIKTVTLTPGSISEQLFESHKIWNNVAISRDGKRLAATTIDQDTTIYVYDFVTEFWVAYQLYSPTFSDGIKSGGPIYADALEWNATGDQLVFDCYNEFENINGSNIAYWDINFIQVWDTTANDFGDGTITKLFPSLPADVSVGNPTFAKNSRSIIAFDYIDEAANELYVVGCNTETNNVSPITYSNVLSYPNFNRTDHTLAYVYDMGTTTTRKTIWRVDLAADKISPDPAGDEVQLYNYSTWPVYYSNGTRLATSVLPKNTAAQSLLVFPNPNNGDASLLIDANEASNAVVKITDASGRLLSNITITLAAGENNIPLSLPANAPAGFYLVAVESGQKKWIGRLVKI